MNTELFGMSRSAKFAQGGGLSKERKPLTNQSSKAHANPGQLAKNTGLKKVYRDYSPKFILILLMLMTFFSSVVYLAERGVIILKW